MGGSPFLPRADRDALVLRQRGISLASHMTTVWVDCSSRGNKSCPSVLIVSLVENCAHQRALRLHISAPP